MGLLHVLLFMPFKGENSFESLNDETSLVDFFAKYFPDTKEVIPDLVRDFFKILRVI